jgi:hypothetical protein
MTVNASLKMSLSVAQSGANAFSGGPHWSAAIEHALALVNGTGANQCDIAYVAERTVASATNDDIDLAGVLADALGQTINAVELVAVVIVNKQKDGTANTTNLTIGGAASPVPGFANALAALAPGGVFLMASPGAAGLATVTGSSGDLLRVANSSGAQAKYVIGILARSA